MSSSPTTQEHREQAPDSVRVAVLTISDTRTPDDDRSGKIIREHLDWRGHVVADYRIVPDDAAQIVPVIKAWMDDDRIQAIVTNGGTGIAHRDVTVDAIARLMDKQLAGFGELFRMLSWPEIGSASMLSRAIAGTAGRTAIFCTPGSSNAVSLAMEKLIGPELGHVVLELNK